MRIRNAAIAGATALAVAFGGTTVASADETVDQNGNNVTVEQANPSKTGNGQAEDQTPEDYTPSLSSKIGNKLEGDQAANGVGIFGSSKDFSGQPAWAKVFYGATVVAGIGALLGGIIGPVYNFFVHGPSF
ncbi:hypothetical protein [Corynebacterium tuberculostearicum]|uniref:hypothetical protein n=1 Tax=Corynebacterium tuberculostearicum TaxID=38304 RepID=UPI00264707B8|nr:hypothetical protein [Corynebacterium tuberculostearicum]MDV2432234.1 hypothetical protein [Corynebacterium tuberculostearicum]WKE57736.1 hypothetical protein J8247_02080 [Corynebacterium tuberculostearicum]WKE59233.1 hypothetical protein KAH61_09610 [Corynebacterium tuberculostearicum]